MSDDAQEFQADYIELTADLVSAYVSNNSIPASALPDLLNNVHAAISGLASRGSEATETDKIEKATPAQIKKSISPDALISFEDGKPYKTLRRHLTLRGLSPEAYRAKYGLPPDYPMTSASYSAQRSELARSLGLGQPRRAPAPEPEETVVQDDAPVSEKPKRAGRPRKAATA
ncbi:MULTISPECIES: MucR family transcriptional regulator [unclassified Methylobacterium]|uniref:MucR family transcriptional regulator n=1 Tax=unclassified Methylobacterium TaxID=2615210 RepID=UPI0006FC263C|nr:MULTISPECIES: MucR family transcriptional regulator [unclassified Methylobacterium]KQO49384.1 MucR family transcriptional regulator [Methylobacterium sp. Leaf86]KQP00389.1 MucR family transcriptional regulator [Methylobacterium sp. Leaf91]